MTQAACEIVTCTIRTKLTKLPKTHAACGVHRLQHIGIIGWQALTASLMSGPMTGLQYSSHRSHARHHRPWWMLRVGCPAGLALTLSKAQPLPRRPVTGVHRPR